MVFLGTYYTADAVQYYMNPDLELEELHYYLTSTNNDIRYPKIPEIAASIVSVLLTPILLSRIRM